MDLHRRLTSGGLVGGSPLLFRRVVVVGGLAASTGVDGGAEPHATFPASAAIVSGLVGARREHGDVEVEGEDEVPLPGAPNVGEICLEGNPPKP